MTPEPYDEQCRVDTKAGWMMLPHYPGMSYYQKWIRSGKPSTLIERLQGAIAAIHAVEPLNKAGIVHRDLRLDNIISIDEQFARVVDFGSAIYAEEVPYSLMPTLYMPPEDIRAQVSSNAFQLIFCITELFAGVPAITKAFENERIKSFSNDVALLSHDNSGKPQVYEQLPDMQRLYLKTLLNEADIHQSINTLIRDSFVGKRYESADFLITFKESLLECFIQSNLLDGEALGWALETLRGVYLAKVEPGEKNTAMFAHPEQVERFKECVNSLLEFENMIVPLHSKLKGRYLNLYTKLFKLHPEQSYSDLINSKYEGRELN